MAQAIILMGVSGCGKTSVGRELSDSLGWPFYDGDDFHPQTNIDKMTRGIPLGDDDRRPWLERLHEMIVEHLDDEQSVILACSALKRTYREILQGDRQEVRFVYLAGTFDLIYQRMQERREHYMKADMLRSQFTVLEPPQQALTVTIDKPVAKIVGEIIANLSSQADRGN